MNLDNYPTVRLILRSLVAGLGGFLTAVYATGYDNMTTGDWVDYAIAAAIVGLGFSGLSATTPIDQSVSARNSK